MKVDKSKWEKKTLGEVGKIITGSTPKTNNPLNWVNGTHNWVTPAELRGEKYYGSTLKKITDVAIKSTNLTLMPIGTVLLSSRAPIGKVAITTEPMYCNQGFKNIECNPSIIHNEFLYFYLKYNNDELNRRGNGVTFKEISKKIVDSFPVVVPNLKEQQSIASELDAIQTMIDGYKAQLDDLDELAKSIFLDMFGDPIENPKGWEITCLKDVGTFARGVSKHRPRNAPELLGGTMPLIQTGDIANAGMYILTFKDTYSDLGIAQSKVWPSGTLCITIAANIGKCSILTFDACFPDSVVGYSVNKEYILNEYVYFVFLGIQNMVESKAAGIAQKNINLQFLNALAIPVPPLPLQQRFAAKIEAIETQKEKYKAQLADAEQLMAERMQYYFS